jgi:Zn-dependent peptidase ImmA (M78 family)
VRRGFKADAERTALQLRSQLDLGRDQPLDLLGLAKLQTATIRSADELVDIEKLKRLEEIQPGAFSACTFTLPDGSVVVYNPLSSLGRRNSDIGHELAHLILKHPVRNVERLGALTFTTCDPEEEQEANWLAGALLLPRDTLSRAVRRGLTADDIANEHLVSLQMANFRLRATGVLLQQKARTRVR